MSEARGGNLGALFSSCASQPDTASASTLDGEVEEEEEHGEGEESVAAGDAQVVSDGAVDEVRLVVRVGGTVGFFRLPSTVLFRLTIFTDKKGGERSTSGRFV